MLLVPEAHPDGRRDGPDPHLERRFVRDQVRNVLADPALHVADLAGGVDVGRLVDLDRQVDLADVDVAVAVSARHRLVELCNDRPGATDRGLHRFNGRSQRAEAVDIRRRHVGEDGIERQQAALHQQRDVRQLDRDELRPSFIDGGPSVRTDEERPVEEVTLHLGGKVRVWPLAVEVNDFDVLQLRGLAAQGVEEHGRRGGRALDVNLLAGLYC